MEINYKRDITKSFMCITGEDEWSSFEKETLVRNKIRGLLEVSVTSENNEAVCWYDITGMQALDGIVENKYMKKDMFIQLLICLCDVIEQIDSYLLRADALRLSPESIFWDYKKQAYEFCYNPAGANGIADDFQGLMEFLLTKIDHSDKETVRIAYQVYNESMKSGYSILTMRESLLTENSHHIEECQTESESIGLEQDVTESFKEERAEQTVKTKQRSVIGSDLLWEKIKTKGNEIYKTAVRYFFPDIIKLKEQKNTRKKQQRVIEPVIFEPEEQQVKSGRPTVLLSEQNMEPGGILKYEGEHCLSDLKINELPYIIGNSNECGGRIESETVSRQHAKITKVENIYFIEDLNSSNGTKVGGKILDYKMKVSLERNEVIEFADEKFRFI